MRPPDDHAGAKTRELLSAARCGEEWALVRLLAPHWGSLKLFCGLMLSDADAAERALAETALTARAELDVVESTATMRVWIHGIAARVCLQAVDDCPLQNDQPPELRRDPGAVGPGMNGADDHE